MTIINVPVTKAGKTAFVQLDTDLIPEAMYAEIFLQGSKVVCNRGASKITKEAIPDEAERHAEAMLAAEKQVKAIYEGTIKITGGKAKKASGAVMTEARRLAKGLVKDALKAAGHKISHIEASEITRLANEALDNDPSIIETAKANLEERSKVPVAAEIIASVKVSPKLVAKAEADKAKKKEQLSAAQAGKTKTRTKPAQANA